MASTNFKQNAKAGCRSVRIASFGIAIAGFVASSSLSRAQNLELPRPSQVERLMAIEQVELPALLARHNDQAATWERQDDTGSSKNLAARQIAASNDALPNVTSTIKTAIELSLPASLSSASDEVQSLPLGAREVGCCAAQRWKPALGLKQRAQTIQRLYCQQSETKRQAAAGIAQFLNLQAYHQEDLAAATAMRAYYSRIGIAEQQKAITTGSEAVDLQRSKQERLMAQGLPAAIDLTSLDRQQIDLKDQSLQASAQDDQLRRLISGMTCIDYQTDQRALEPLVIEPTQLNCDALVALGLRDRYDLQAWRCLCQNINEDSAPLLASVIATSVGSYGIPIPKTSGLKTLLCSDFDKELLAKNLRQEVATIIATNESYAEQLIVEKCSQLQLAYQRWELQLQRISTWEYRLKQIERLEALGDTRPAERATAEAGLLKAKAEEIARRLDAKLAEVSLAEVVGGLAGKCCRGEAWLPR